MGCTSDSLRLFYAIALTVTSQIQSKISHPLKNETKNKTKKPRERFKRPKQPPPPKKNKKNPTCKTTGAI